RRGRLPRRRQQRGRRQRSRGWALGSALAHSAFYRRTAWSSRWQKSCSGTMLYLEGFSDEVESTCPASPNIVEGGKQRLAPGPGGDRRDKHRRHGEPKIAGGTERNRAQQRGERVADGCAGDPGCDRFGKAEGQDRDPPADHPALEPEQEKVPEEAVGDIAVA